MKLNLKLLALAAAATVVVAACSDDTDDGPGNDTSNQSVTLSSFIRTITAMNTNDTSLPVEINGLNIDTASEDAADANYAAVLGA